MTGRSKREARYVFIAFHILKIAKLARELEDMILFPKSRARRAFTAKRALSRARARAKAHGKR